ncbi:GlsB/YeaQ/YmgE family stress response membrane protein [Fodinibius sp.]|uniref:GlsB/YeaQ/YmgE family stress response membrane protein n=1 Tax=Fodinibius sp. TaxID=1872440 RepID=UPI003565AAD9
MSLTGLLILLLIAAICGGIGQSIAGYSLGGCLVSIVVGFIGAFIGKWIAAEMGLTLMLPVEIDGETFPIIWSIIGAALFTIVIGLITRGRSPRV